MRKKCEKTKYEMTDAKKAETETDGNWKRPTLKRRTQKTDRLE
jgi:hypothetical protein